MGIVITVESSKNVRRGNGVLASISYTFILQWLSISVSSELPRSVIRCPIGAGDDPSRHNAVMDERGMTTDVGAKLLFTSFRSRSVSIDRIII